MDNTPIILSENDISSLKGKHGVVLFYMDGCNPCNMIKPHWNRAIKELKNDVGEDIILGAVETQKLDSFNKHINVRRHVNGFPTILYLHPSNHSSPEVYKGDRNHGDIKAWILEKKNRRSGENKHDNHTHAHTHIEKKESNTRGYQGGGGTRRRRRSIKRRTKQRYGSRMRIHKRRKTMRRSRKTIRKQSGGGCGCGSINFFGTPAQKTKQPQKR